MKSFQRKLVSLNTIFPPLSLSLCSSMLSVCSNEFLCESVSVAATAALRTNFRFLNIYINTGFYTFASSFFFLFACAFLKFQWKLIKCA